MNREEVYALIKQYSNETAHYSYTATDHPTHRLLTAAGKDILPFLLERLRDSVGRERGENFDPDNDPHLLIDLIGKASDERCYEGFTASDAGYMDDLRAHILRWGEAYFDRRELRE